MMSVHDILKHIRTAHCMYCGHETEARNGLRQHIPQCKVYADWRNSAGKAREERDDLVRALRLLENRLAVANQTVAHLQEKLEEYREKEFEAARQHAEAQSGD